MAQRRHELASLREQWEAEKLGMGDVQKVRQQLADVELEFEQLDASIKQKMAVGQPIPEQDYQRLYELDVQRKQLNERIEAEAAEEEDGNDAGSNGEKADGARRRLLRQEVTEEEIAEVVSAWTGIPITRMIESERAKLLVMEERIHERLIGQDEAVEAVSNAVRRNRSGLQDPNRPIGSFIFLGPTGVGKTELCKALAEVMFDDENAMVRLDMSEFMERHTVSRLIGAPPGYVGYEEGGRLTQAVRRRPYAVILLDEIEKAHRDVFNVLLQILDDGRLSDNHGHTVDFTNTIIVMTSNIGSQFIQRMIDSGTGESTASDIEIEMKVTEALKDSFRPEFLNRIDETIIFQQLSREQLCKIGEIQVRHLEGRLADREMTIELTDAARHKLATDGFDPSYGARPIKRLIQQEIENPLARRILEGKFAPGDHIVVDAPGEVFTFETGGVTTEV